jgi:hypothetical protein
LFFISTSCKEGSDKEVSDKEVSDKEVSDKEVSDKEVSDKEVFDYIKDKREDKYDEAPDDGLFFHHYAREQPFLAGLKNHLEIRELPSENSRIIGRLEYNEIIIAKTKDVHDDSAYGMSGEWVEVQYQNKKGFIFDAFLVPVQKSNDVNGDFRILFEGKRKSWLNYDPGLIYYGMYSEGNNQRSLRKVELNLKCRSYGTCDVSTNFNKKSIILIGSKMPLREGILKDYFFPKQGLFLHPGQYKTFFSGGSNPFCIQAIAEEKNSQNNNDVAYNLKLMMNARFPVIDKDSSEYLMEHVLGATSLDVETATAYSTPALVWAGFLDGDKLPDFIFNTKIGIESCSKGSLYSLALSTPAKGKMLVKVAGISEF